MELESLLKSFYLQATAHNSDLDGVTGVGGVENQAYNLATEPLSLF